ncbi:MAG: type II secretion system major pseudopilin GspG [Aquificaceae bacterium]|jgi:general secretion pathway protein G|uniref:type II secretion system major pseudopilin GspG n=1 Tax=Hydrogenobacter sp. Uz 6-8 TaxID=3384828 RepID=UPI00309C3988
MEKRNSLGFTLIEILIVVIIIGLLAALVAPRLVGKLTESKEKIARQQIAMLSTALDLYRADVGRYPSTQEGLEALIKRPESVPVDRWKGPYLRQNKLPLDPWGHSYVYYGPEDPRAIEKGVDYIIISYGADGKEGGSGESKDISNLD